MPSDWLERFRGRTVLVTGHTGFKGGWLALWLRELGARVVGIGLPPDPGPSLFELGRVAEGMDSRFGDIRDLDGLKAVFGESRPEMVFHLAAQSLVRRSYRDPADTFATNVLGTAHVLEAARLTPSVRAIVSVTSDKCYENRGWAWGYRETDAMGGHDPYSASKGAAEIVTASYRRSYFQGPGGARLASARAGNAIGGGDWAEDRIVPDLVRSAAAGTPARVRNPEAVRPWQHVLDPLAGYLRLAALLDGDRGADFAEGWNFGPSDGSAVPVRELVRLLRGAWPGTPPEVVYDEDGGPHEAHWLQLDVSKARREMGWRPVLDLEGAVRLTADWYGAYLRAPALLPDLTLRQIAEFTQQMGGR